jgi:primase-polymerase (primpol)-like protein
MESIPKQVMESMTCARYTHARAVITPRWLEQYQTPKARAPQKGPPPNGPLRVDPLSIPLELRRHHAWANWAYEYADNRWSKPPYDPFTGEVADPADIATWSDFEDCWRAYQDRLVPKQGQRPYDGVSFALNYRFGLVGIDLDHISEHRLDADRIVRTVDSYTEHSPSGDGYRIFVRGTLPEGRRRRDWVEMTTRRFFSVTGHRLTEAPATIQSNQRGLYDVWARYVRG